MKKTFGYQDVSLSSCNVQYKGTISHTLLKLYYHYFNIIPIFSIFKIS